MNDTDILKAAVKAAYTLGPFLPETVNGKVRIPFNYPRGSLTVYYMIYNPEEEEIVAIERLDGSLLLLD
jgi:hypothetical protein